VAASSISVTFFLLLQSAALHAQPVAYSLAPDKLAKALALNRQETILEGISLLWGFLFPLLLLRLRIASFLSRFAARSTRHAWLQGFIVLPILLLLVSLLDLPPAVAGHRISLSFGLSIEPWAAWFGDWGKGLLLTLFAGSSILSILFAIVRHGPRFWWFWFWLISIPLTLASVYAVPILIDPIFNHYEPLRQSNPQLVQRLEMVVRRSGIVIPPERMFLMKASEKVTTANAYVTGFGASKRVVVWDTTIHSSTPDGILFIFGHELGHYVLGHVLIGTVLGILGTLTFLWSAFHFAHWLLRRFGSTWGVAEIGDWASVVVLLFVAHVLAFLSSPIENAISRYFEHQADIYGEEVIHGIVADPRKTAQQSFQQLGEDSLDIPHPNPVVVFWDYSHPTTFDRATFALRYDPWAPGHKPRYVR